MENKDGIIEEIANFLEYLAQKDNNPEELNEEKVNML